jgi:hypothetical protein
MSYHITKKNPRNGRYFVYKKLSDGTTRMVKGFRSKGAAIDYARLKNKASK